MKCLSLSGGGVMIRRGASDSLQFSVAALLCLEVQGIQQLCKLKWALTLCVTHITSHRKALLYHFMACQVQIFSYRCTLSRTTQFLHPDI